MEPKMIAKQMIDFNKSAFDNTFDTITILLYYSEKIARFFCEKARFLSPEGEKVIIECMEACIKSRKDFKDSVDESFNAFEHFFVDWVSATGFFVDILTKNTEQSVKEGADTPIQTKTSDKEDTERQEKTEEKAEEKAAVEVEPSSRAVRRSAKQLKIIKNKIQEDKNGPEANRKTDD